MVRSLRRAILILSAVVSVLSLAPGPASADKLILFKNGKAMRVKSVTNDGTWAKCEFEDKNYLSIPAARILSIEEATAGSAVGDLKPVQIAAGSGGGFNPGPGGIGAGGLPPEVSPTPDETAQQQADVAAAMAEEQAARANQAQQQNQGFGTNQGVGRRGVRIGGNAQGVTPFGQQGGIQPINQAGSIFQNRSLTQRNNNINAPRSSVIQNQNQAQNSEN